jgi:hypothetical protein
MPNGIPEPGPHSADILTGGLGPTALVRVPHRGLVAVLALDHTSAAAINRRATGSSVSVRRSHCAPSFGGRRACARRTNQARGGQPESQLRHLAGASLAEPKPSWAGAVHRRPAGLADASIHLNDDTTRTAGAVAPSSTVGLWRAGT